MGFQVPVDSNFDPSDSVFVNCPMRAHVAIVDVDEDGMRLGGKNNKGEMVVEFEILTASVTNQEGLRHRTFFTKSAQAAWRIHRFAIAAGIITADEINKLKESGDMPNYEFEQDAKGKQLFVDIVNNEYNGKVNQKIEGGFFHLASKQCQNKGHWPRNEAMIAKSGVKMPESKDSKPGTTTNATQGTSGKSQDKAPPAQSAADDDLLGGVEV